MFRMFTRAAWLGCCIGVMMSGADAQAAATMSLKAVAKNGVPITPTNNLTGVVAGDTITAELRVSGWSHPYYDLDVGNTGLVRTYQAQLDGLIGVQSGGEGLITLDGWDAPLIKDSCPCTDPLYPTCSPQYGCVGPNFRPEKMASINTSRTDFIFYGFATQPGVANDSLDLKWGALITDVDGVPDGRCVGGINANGPCETIAQCPGGTSCNVAFSFYAGTLNLVAGQGICGTFTFAIRPDDTVTFLVDPLPNPIPVLPLVEPLLITSQQQCATGACCNENTSTCTENVTLQNCQGPGQRWGGAGTTCATINPPCSLPGGACCNENTGVCTNGVQQSDCQSAGQRWGGAGSICATLNPPCTSNVIVSSNPTHCAIDARVPYPPGQQALKKGFQAIVLTFARTAGPAEDSASDYTVQQFPPGTLSVIGNVALSGNTATLTFTQPILTRRWTCVLHNASNTRRCLGYLPADANGNGTSAPADILDIVDNLNGVRNPPLTVYQCDIDRTGTCAPADILSEIDLLNGANSYPNTNGWTLEACPSTGP